ncbi:MAG: class I tRNA ligase family protein, partial [Coriobacteriaceae bacterium]|nr:class I tRNA ligase family protein [Coriobacteriaceae bacterium]
MSDKPNYKHTMNLPQTSFKMKASLPQREPERLKKWEEMDLYAKVLEANKDCEPFILHDGPPYANGPIHIGHAFNKVLKDIIVKYKTMRGYYAPYVPGWDCHGLPIENKVEDQLGPEKMKKVDTPTFRKICREYATKQLDGQREGFKRLGVCGEWDNPYLTYLPEYEAGNIEIFKKLYLDGSVYRGRKPIHWCSHCHTALAEAEIEYADEVSPSIYVKFRLTAVPAPFAAAADAAGIGTANVVIWTTTPWTLPANQAVCLAPDAEYVAAVVDGELVVMAAELSQAVADVAGWGELSFLEQDGQRVSCLGSALEGGSYHHPIHAGETGVILTGTHVTLDTGTGAVHTAPGHGVDDYKACQAAGIKDIKMPVDDEG